MLHTVRGVRNKNERDIFAFILEKQSSGVQKIRKQKKKGNWWFCVVFYGNDLLQTLNGI